MKPGQLSLPNLGFMADDAEVAIVGFNLFRSDRQGRQKGGTCIYLRDDSVPLPILQFSNGVVEALVLKIKEMGTILFSMYRPPDTKFEEFHEAISNT